MVIRIGSAHKSALVVASECGTAAPAGFRVWKSAGDNVVSRETTITWNSVVKVLLPAHGLLLRRATPRDTTDRTARDPYETEPVTPTVADPLAPYVDEIGARLRHVEKMAAVARRNTFARRPPRRPALIDLNTVVLHMRPLVQRLAGPFIAVEELLAVGGAWLEADFGQLGQVLLNLVANARDAMPLGGSLRLGTFRWDRPTEHSHRYGTLPGGSWTVLEVRDTGTGMDADVLEHLFEPFFTTKSPGEGTGLGLAAVYGLARQLGGQVIVDSTTGQGSTFAVCLPAKEAPAGRPLSGNAPAAILVVDDDEWVRTVTARILRRAGYGVLEADHATSAMELLRDVAGGCVRLVLTDIMMAGMNGHALAEVVRRDHPGVQVVLMSGGTSDVHPEELSDAESGRVLTKPFTAVELLEAVRVRAQ